MKKFWVGLLSMIVLVGGCLLSACGQPEVSITLSDSYKEICLNAENEEPIATVTAEMHGIPDGSVTVSSSYENIVRATVTYNSTTNKNIISIYGISEGHADVLVSSNYQSSVSSNISVDVYSVVTGMEQIEEDTQNDKSNLFAIRGDTVTLAKEKLITFTPTNSRKNITWTLSEESQHASLVHIENDQLTIDDLYPETTVKLVATADTGVSTEVILSVLDKINEDCFKMMYAYSTAQNFEPLAGEKIEIVPNISADPHYLGYIKFAFSGQQGLEIVPKITLNGTDSRDLQITRQSILPGEDETIYLYQVRAASQNVNNTFDANFFVGYEKFNYSVNSADFQVASYEKINKINVYNQDGSSAAASVQSIYTSYAFAYGAEFKIELLPTTVVNATGKFIVRVDYSGCSASELVANDVNSETLEFYYKTPNGSFVKLPMRQNHDSDSLFECDDASLPNATAIYVLANSDFVRTSLSNVKVTFIAADNTEVQAPCVFNLYKSASQLEFTGDDTSVSLATSTLNMITKTFTLNGQSSIEGLYVETNGLGFEASDIVYITSTPDSVTFSITFRVNAAGFGLTENGSYQIKHRNGIQSAKYAVQLFLPLENGQVIYDALSSVVTRYSNANDLYIVQEDGLVRVEQDTISVNDIMMKANSTVPLSFLTNKINGHSAEALRSYAFLDLSAVQAEDATMTEDAFRALTANEIYTHVIKANTSEIIRVSGDSLITTGQIGLTYMIVTFTGIDISGNEVQFVRIVRLENYVAPSEFVVTPSSAVEIYAFDSVASKDNAQTKQKVKITFSSTPITYTGIDCFQFYSYRMGSPTTKTEQIISWADSYFNITDITVTGTFIEFTVNGLTTKGVQNFVDNLMVTYQSGQGDNVTLSAVVSLKIMNATRVEKLIWENESQDGLYFEVGDKEPLVIVTSYQPVNVKNQDLTYLVTDTAGNIANFVTVQSLEGKGQVMLKASHGASGYIYILPSDAINAGNITYYDKTVQEGNGVDQIGSLLYSRLGQIKVGQQTWFDYLCQNAYFINNQGQQVSFANFLIRIDITIADGSSPAYAYNLYNSEDFETLDPSKYYRVMNNVTLNNWKGLDESAPFTGGIFGKNSDVRITLRDSNAFVHVNQGEIYDLTLAGNVNGSGFVANMNEGIIKNVTIDVDIVTKQGAGGVLYSIYQSSVLNAQSIALDAVETVGEQTYVYVGGIAGINKGKLEQVKVLGATVVGSFTGGQILGFVGGIAGKNVADGTVNGSILDAKCEIYNFEAQDGSGNAVPNSLTGNYVGGIVGYASGGSITNSYLYDYAAVGSTDSHLVSVVGGNGESGKGAFIGKLTDATTIVTSFAMANISAAFAGDDLSNYTNITLASAYISYYQMLSGTPTLATRVFVNNVMQSESNFSSLDQNIWMTASSQGFDTNVNGGKPYFKHNYQPEALSSVDAFAIQDVQNNGLYHSLQVSNTDAMLLNYAVSSAEQAGMNSSELQALEALNTISIASLFNISEDMASRLVLATSDASIVSVDGINIFIRKTGSTTITLSSKQDYTLTKTFTVQVVYALSTMNASWAYLNGSENIEDNATVNLQRGKSLTVTYDFAYTNLYLGNHGNQFALIQNDYQLVWDKSVITTANPVSGNFAGKHVLTLTSTDTTEDTPIYTYLSLNSLHEQAYQTKIKNTFYKNFDLALFNGAISLGLANNEIGITPSTVGVTTAQLLSSSEADDLIPSISLKIGDTRIELTSKSTSSPYLFQYGENENRIQISIEKNRSATADANGIYTYDFKLYFEVTESYRGLISDTENYEVTLTSKTQVVSQAFILKVTKQGFTNIDIANYRIKGTSYQPQPENPANYVTMYQASNETTGVISPGANSLMRVNINPQYAYYKYFTIEYSGAPIAGAATIKYMQSKDGLNFYEDSTSEINPITNGLQVVPSNPNQEFLYFKIWASDSNKEDTMLTFTVKFYDGKNADPVTFAKYYLSISYLSEPQVLVDGSISATLAKGMTSEVKVVVDYDTSIDISTATLENVDSGISLGSTWTEEGDPKLGQKTYTTTLTAGVKAKLKTDASGKFYVTVAVERIVNGNLETKNASAEVTLVDFKIDADNISVQNAATADTFVTYLGVSQTLQFSYPLLPESYTYDKSDTESVAAVNALENARNSFTNYGYYPNASAGDAEGQYYINYNPDYDIQNPSSGANVPTKLGSRLYYYSAVTQNWNGIEGSNGDMSSVGGYLEFIPNSSTGSSISVKGLRLTNDSNPICLRMDTIVRVGETKTIYSYYFNVEVKAYSDEADQPLIVRDAEGFMDMASGDAQDYILMNDIVLSNYSPFATDSIRSLDGNGYTIYIESFNMAPVNTSSLDLALFTTVNSMSTLKNVRVNLYNGGQIVADVSRYTSVNVAGLAITNNGTITNSEVVSFSTSDAGKVSSKLSGDTGIQITYIKGAGTSTPVYLTDASNWNSSVAGFVLENAGNITNSRVGGDSVLEIGSEQYEGTYNANTILLKNFNIRGQGNMAGFILNNTGAVASSFAKNIGINNESDSTNYYTAGFIGVNNGRVITSYVEGVQEDAPSDLFCRQGSTVTSKLGVIAGYVYQNKSSIQDAYSNILISNSAIGYTSYLASGFVYQNEGTILNSYSASQITSLRYSQMNFSGVDASGNLLSTMGTYVNCYYYSSKNSEEDTTESSYNTGASRLANVTSEEYFYGFSFTSVGSSEDGVWQLTDKGPALTEPNFIATSNRYYLITDETQGIYTLPYATLVTDQNKTIVTNIGSRSNPIIIRSAQEYVSVMGKSTSVYISSQFTKTQIKGNYRLVNNIDFNDLLTSEEETTVDLPSTEKTLTGSFFGNGFTMDNLSIASSNTAFAYGLFASVENAIIINLNLSVAQVVNNQAALVGGIAGFIKNSKLTNVTVTFKDAAVVEGLNFVGGVAGMVSGNTVIKNISATSPNVIADRYVNNGVPGEEGSHDTGAVGAPITTLTASREADLRLFISQQIGDVFITELNPSILSGVIAKISNYSYAGGLFGVVDIYSKDEQNATSYSHPTKELAVQDFDMSRLRVYETVKVKGQVAGGLVGFSGYNTYVKDAGLELNAPQATSNSHIVATRYYAGGIIGQSYGYMTQLYTLYTKSLQDTIENNLRNYYQSSDTAERGAADIFEPASDSESYDRLYIGGLLGYVGSGYLNISYSKINVVGTSVSYAGGIIGNINSGKASGYYINDGTNNILTNFAISEVYASGDVRGEKAAGGIIGQIQDGSMTKLMTVNAVNMISFYNYQTKQNYTEQELVVKEGEAPEYNFAKANIYAILGAFGDTKNGVIASWSDTDKTTALELVQLATQGEASGSIDVKPSVGSVNSLTTSIVGNVGLELYPGADKILNEGSASNVKKVQTFIIPSISNYQTAASGYEDTFGAFLGSDMWAAEHWYHAQETLYPTIKFSIAQESYIYLDNYNIQEVLDVMKVNSSIEVRVRGRVAENSDECKDVDLRPKMADQTAGLISGYRGKLVGNIAQVNSTESDAQQHFGEYVGLLLTGPLFESVTAGFRMQDLQIYYRAENTEVGIYKTNSSDTGNGYQGAFINGSVSDAVISNVNFDFIGNIFLKGNANGNVGLLAPSIKNSNIGNIIINVRAGDNSRFLTVSGGSNVGLVAGIVEQDSDTKTMGISNIRVYDRTPNPSGLLYLENASVKGDGINVGGLFGEMKRTANSNNNYQPEDFKFVGNDFVHVSDKNPQKATADKELFAIESVAGAVNMGGLVGRVQDITEISIAPTQENFMNAEFQLGGSKEEETEVAFTSASVGGLFGTVEGSTKISLSGDDTKNNIINIGVSAKENEKAETYHFGGFIGNLDSSVETEITNISVNLDVFEPARNRHEATSSSDPKTIKENYVDHNSTDGGDGADFDASAFFPIKSAGTINVGGYVGTTTSDLSIRSTQKMTINSGYDAIALQASKVNAGSLVGNVNYESRGKKFVVSGNIQSQALFSLSKYESNTKATKESENDLKVGGLIGSIYAVAGNSIVIGTTNQVIGYTGQIFSAVPNANYGGIVGDVKVTSSTSGTNKILTIQRTVFGGAIKIHGRNSQNGSFVIGGTIGKLTGDEAKIVDTVSVQDNYNYGDVLALYNGTEAVGFKSLSGMTFGGLVGAMPAQISGTSFDNNYSLMTYNNQRLLMPATSGTAVTETNIHALFGTGFNSGNTERNQTNYYNHDVCLATDNFGVDAGYMTNYALSQTTTGGGYFKNTPYYVDKTVNPGSTDKKGLASIIKAVVSQLDSNIEQGTKLNPISLTADGVPTAQDIEDSHKDVHASNGVTYYYLSSNLTIADNYRIADVLTDTAVIGDGYTITMPVAGDGAYLSSILEMKGSSIVSGVVINVQIDEDSIAVGEGLFTEKNFKENNANVGGLVGTMNGGIIYGVSVQGSLSYGGNRNANVGGIVGKMNRGLITESNTALDILYRAGANGTVSAIANSGINSPDPSNAKNIFISNTYATGSVATYIDANISAFTMNQCVVRNSYTIAKLIWNDYTKAEASPIVVQDGKESSKLHVFDYATSVNYKANGRIENTFYYDQNATEYTAKMDTESNFEVGNMLTTNDFKTQKTSDEYTYLGTGADWVRDETVNFGYPTRNFNYLKLSSYAKIDKTDLPTYANTTTGNIATSNEQTRGILKYKYTRLSVIEMVTMKVDGTGTEVVDTTADGQLQWLNTDKLNEKGYYKLVPNAGLFMEMDAQKYVLMYDIHLQGTQYETAGFSAWKDTGFSGTLDGNDKSIKNIVETNGIFQKLNGTGSAAKAVVRNLNIYTALTNTGTYGALANEAMNVNVSNITINGSLTNGNAGGLLGEAKGSVAIDNIVNMASITSTTTGNVAGIVALVSGETSVNYSSNYGTIRSNGGNAGGLVGSATAKIAIQNSYNTNSVLVNYTGNSSNAGKSGGLVGSMTSGSIENCYNTGIVKAGNKSSTAVSYAGGIVSYGSEIVTINNCLNEGSVEALGKNAEVKMTYDTSNRNITMKALGGKNVYAFGIGYLLSGEITNAKNSAEVENNGILVDDFSLVINTKTRTFGQDFGAGWTDSFREYLNDAPISSNWYDYHSTFNDSPDKTYVITSSDKYGFPTSFYTKYDIQISGSYTLATVPQGEGLNKTIQTYFSWNNYQTDVDAEKMTPQIQLEEKYGTYGYAGGKLIQSNVSSLDKTVLTPKTEEISGSDTKTSINGQLYALTNGNIESIMAAMQSNMFVYTGSMNIPDIPKLNKNYFSVKTNNDKISSVEIIDIKDTTVEFNIYSTSPLNSDEIDSLKISLNYSINEKVKMNLSDLNYSFNESGTIKIYLSLEQTKLFKNNAETFNFIKDGNTLLDNYNIGYRAELPTNDGKATIYLIYNKEEKTLSYYRDIMWGEKKINEYALTPTDFSGKNLTVYYSQTEQIEVTPTIQSTNKKVTGTVSIPKSTNQTEEQNKTIALGGDAKLGDNVSGINQYSLKSSEDPYMTMLEEDKSVSHSDNWYSDINFSVAVNTDASMASGEIYATDENGSQIVLMNYTMEDGWNLVNSIAYIMGTQFNVAWDGTQLSFTYAEADAMNETGYNALMNAIAGSLNVSDETMIQLNYQAGTPSVTIDNYDEFDYRYTITGDGSASLYDADENKVATYENKKWQIFVSNITISGVNLEVKLVDDATIQLYHSKVTNKDAILADLGFNYSVLYDDYTIQLELDVVPSGYDVVAYLGSNKLGTYSNGTWTELNADFDSGLVSTAGTNYRAYTTDNGSGKLILHIKEFFVGDALDLSMEGNKLNSIYKNTTIGVDISGNNYKAAIVDGIAAFSSAWQLGGKTEHSFVVNGNTYLAKLSVNGNKLVFTFDDVEMTKDTYDALLNKVKDLTYYYQNNNVVDSFDYILDVTKIDNLSNGTDSRYDYNLNLTYKLDEITILGDKALYFDTTLNKETGALTVSLNYDKISKDNTSEYQSLNGIAVYIGTYGYEKIKLDYLLGTVSGKLKNNNVAKSYYELSLTGFGETLTQESEIVGGGESVTFIHQNTIADENIVFEYKIYNSSITVKFANKDFTSKNLTQGDVRLVLSESDAEVGEYRGILEMNVNSNNETIFMNNYSYTYEGMNLYYEYLESKDKNELVWYNESEKNKIKTEAPIARLNLDTGEYTFSYDVEVQALDNSTTGLNLSTFYSNDKKLLGASIDYRLEYGYYKDTNGHAQKVLLTDCGDPREEVFEMDTKDINGNLIKVSFHVYAYYYENNLIMIGPDLSILEEDTEDIATISSYYIFNFYEKAIKNTSSDINSKDYVYDGNARPYGKDYFLNYDVTVKKLIFNDALDNATIYLDFNDSMFTDDGNLKYNINKPEQLANESPDKKLKSYFKYKLQDEQFTLIAPEQNSKTQEFKFDLTENTKLEFKGSYNDDLIITEEMYHIEGNKLIFDYKYDNKNELNIQANITGSLSFINAGNTANLKEQEKSEIYEGVIFTRNLWCGNKTIFNITSNVCGNNYYIMFYSDDSAYFINNVGNANIKDNYLRDVNILVQLRANDDIHTNYSVINNNYAIIKNMKLFGSIRSVNSQNKKVAGAIFNNFANIDTLSSYISIDGLNAVDSLSNGTNGESVTSQISGIFFNNATGLNNKNIQLYSTIIAGDGGSGGHGLNAQDARYETSSENDDEGHPKFHFEGSNGSAGGNAGAGGNVCTVSWLSENVLNTESYTSEGIIKAGNAGINGRGGNGSNGYDLLGFNLFESNLNQAKILSQFSGTFKVLNDGGNGALAGQLANEATIDNEVVVNSDSFKQKNESHQASLGGNGGRGGISHSHLLTCWRLPIVIIIPIFPYVLPIGWTTYWTEFRTGSSLGAYGKSNSISDKGLTKISSSEFLVYNGGGSRAYGTARSSFDRARENWDNERGSGSMYIN